MIGPILVACEEQSQRKRIVDVLTNLNYRVIESESGMRTIETLYQRKHITLALIDFAMSDLGGTRLISQIRSMNISTPIVLLMRDNVETQLLDALKAGASDFISIFASPLRIGVTTASALQRSTLEREISIARRDTDYTVSFSEYISKSPAIRAMLASARAAAQSDRNLFIYGEQATGREAIARTIHHESALKDGPFIRIQCSSIFDGRDFELRWIEELKEKIPAATGGSLCLFDVDRLTLAQQHALDSLLEEISGSSAANIADSQTQEGGTGVQQTMGKMPFRLIAISTTPFDDLMNSHFYLTSLCKKLNGIFVGVPPLRQRREDLAGVANKMLENIVIETGQTHVIGLSGVATALLTQHSWPGNLSELHNMLFRAALLSKGPLLGAQDFPQLVSTAPRTEETTDENEKSNAQQQQLRSYFTEDKHIKPMQQIEREAIELAIKRYDHRMSEISRRLNIGRSTLYRKLEEYANIPQHLQ